MSDEEETSAEDWRGPLPAKNKAAPKPKSAAAPAEHKSAAAAPAKADKKKK